MKNIFLAAFLLLVVACGGDVPAPMSVIDNIPATAPQLAADITLDRALYPQRVNIAFEGDKAVLSQLPAGVAATVDGAFVTLRSQAAGVEYVVRGRTDDGSLTIVSEKSPLITFDSLDIHSVGCNAVTVSSREKIFLSGSHLFLSDEVARPGELVKQAATLALMGDAVLCDGLDVCLQATRRDALAVTGILYQCGATLAVEYATGCAVNVMRGFVVAGGSLSATAMKDVVRVRRGNFVMLGGTLSLGAAADRADGLVARNIYVFDGAIMADVQGAAAKGLSSKESVFLVGGELKVHTSGGALFSEKKSDYSSSSCVKSGLNTYIRSANISLVSDGDAGKGINCDGRLQVDGGFITIKTVGNDVNHPVDLNAHASPKGIKCDSTILVNGGVMEVLVFGKGERCEGVESKGDMIVNGADTKIYIYAYDDAVNTAGSLTINDGTLYAYSVANDAVDSNGRLEINGGLVLANASHSPEQGIDVDFDNLFAVTGGTIVSCGGYKGGAPALPACASTCVPAVVWSGVDIERDSYVNIAAADDEKALFSYRLPRSMNDVAVMMISPLIEKGGSYSLFLSDSIEAGERVNYGLYAGAHAVGVRDSVEWEQKNLITVVGGNEHRRAGRDAFPQQRPPGTTRRPPVGGGAPPPHFNGAVPPAPNGFHAPPRFDGAVQRVCKDIYNANNLPGMGW